MGIGSRHWQRGEFNESQRFVLGDGVTKAGAYFWDTVHRVARATALPEVNFEVVPAALGDEAPLWGAVSLASDLVSRRELH